MHNFDLELQAWYRGVYYPCEREQIFWTMSIQSIPIKYPCLAEKSVQGVPN